MVVEGGERGLPQEATWPGLETGGRERLLWAACCWPPSKQDTCLLRCGPLLKRACITCNFGLYLKVYDSEKNLT